MKLKIIHIRTGTKGKKYERGVKLRIINLPASQKDLLIMMMILGNRHLANLAHFSPHKNKVQKKFAVDNLTCKHLHTVI